ncbi:hypothetical protein PUN28_010888 [Cardiocondyla obscurior]|uniref:Uncharacterized protein n=1 Tax=Cardiocondyla obscurior TaxID=286306 RepID=A0AAW2FKV6_9HYME
MLTNLFIYKKYYFWYKIKFHICIKKIDLVNKTFKKLGLCNEYHRLRMSIKRALLILLLVTFASWTLDSILCIEMYNDISAIIIPFIMDYSLYVNMIMDIIFMLLVSNFYSKHFLNTFLIPYQSLLWKKTLINKLRVKKYY